MPTPHTHTHTQMHVHTQTLRLSHTHIQDTHPCTPMTAPCHIHTCALSQALNPFLSLHSLSTLAEGPSPGAGWHRGLFQKGAVTVGRSEEVSVVLGVTAHCSPLLTPSSLQTPHAWGHSMCQGGKLSQQEPLYQAGWLGPAPQDTRDHLPGSLQAEFVWILRTAVRVLAGVWSLAGSRKDSPGHAGELGTPWADQKTPAAGRRAQLKCAAFPRRVASPQAQPFPTL